MQYNMEAERYMSHHCCVTCDISDSSYDVLWLFKPPLLHDVG
jgi:hypothetical protein